MAAARTSSPFPAPAPAVERESVVIRFAGDAGDGMMMAGAQFTLASAIHGNDVCTLPDLPAEIRAPAGSLAGVVGFQVHISKTEIHTAGDVLQALVAMNPAALRTHLGDLEPGGIVLLNADAFTTDELHKAGYVANPLDDASLADYRVIQVAINRLTREAVSSLKLHAKEVDRCRNFFALGLTFYLFDRPLDATAHWIREKFAKNPVVAEANLLALRAGHRHGSALSGERFTIPQATLPAGVYRQLNGAHAIVLGLVAAANQAERPLVFAGTPRTPASDILHAFAELNGDQVRMIQAEDEIGALSMALGASFGGAIAATVVSGPGMSLSAEALGLAVMTELPCVVINVQRGGPSTGMPTKTEQADLMQALFGRHGECPLIVLAASSPSDTFAVTYEAARLAVRYMAPVIVLTDVSLVRSAEPWRIPDILDLPPVDTVDAGLPNFRENGTPRFLPYLRDERLARPWAVPGTSGFEHRVTGLEKDPGTGNVSYDPEHHEAMVRARARKIANCVHDIPLLEVTGPAEGDLLVLGWGSTRGAIATACSRARKRGLDVADAHLRYLNPLPANTGEVLRRYRRVLVPELNQGQLVWLLRAAFLTEPVGLHKIQGRSFLVSEIETKIVELMSPR